MIGIQFSKDYRIEICEGGKDDDIVRVISGKDMVEITCKVKSFTFGLPVDKKMRKAEYEKLKTLRKKRQIDKAKLKADRVAYLGKKKK